MKCFRKIIALILVFVTIFMLVAIPASATVGDAVDYELTNMWSYLSRWWSDDSPDIGITYWKNLLSAFLADSNNPTAEDLETAYDTYVENMNVTYNTTNIYADGTSKIYITGFNQIQSRVDTYLLVTYFDSYDGAFSSMQYSSSLTYVRCYASFQVPASGTYDIVVPNISCTNMQVGYMRAGISASDPSLGSYTYMDSASDDDGSGYPNSVVLSCVLSVGITYYFIYFSAPKTVVNSTALFSPSGLPYVNAVSVLGTNDYDDTTRPTIINMPIGYYDDSETFNVVEDTTIINDTNNTYYNPITDESTNITNWYYDYSDRSYNVTLESGDTVTVTYGDENITINEGNNTYNIYYMIYDDGSGSGSDSDDSDTSAFFTWWIAQWTDFRTWLSNNWGSGGSGGSVPSDPMSTDFPGVEDNPETESDDESWSFFDLLIAIKDGTWSITKGTVVVFFGGVTGIISSVISVGNFFDTYDSSSENNIFGITDYGGSDIWD